MRKYLFALLVLVGAGTTLLVAAFAVAGGGSHSISAKDGLTGYQETALTLSTTGSGSFEAKVNNDDSSFDWTLSYGDLEGAVTQSHIHFGARGLTGGISIWLCKTASTAANAPPGTADCPTPGGTLSGTADASDVVGPSGQGIEAGHFDEILAAIRAGKAYANVHSTKYPPGEIRGQLNDPDGKN
jgi:hypothetical protein